MQPSETAATLELKSLDRPSLGEETKALGGASKAFGQSYPDDLEFQTEDV